MHTTLTNTLFIFTARITVYSVLFAIGNISWGWTPPQFLASLYQLF